MGLGFRGLGFRACGLGFGVYKAMCWAWYSRFRAYRVFFLVSMEIIWTSLFISRISSFLVEVYSAGICLPGVVWALHRANKGIV